KTPKVPWNGWSRRKNGSASPRLRKSRALRRIPFGTGSRRAACSPSGQGDFDWSARNQSIVFFGATREASRRKRDESPGSLGGTCPPQATNAGTGSGRFVSSFSPRGARPARHAALSESEGSSRTDRTEPKAFRQDATASPEQLRNGRPPQISTRRDRAMSKTK